MLADEEHDDDEGGAGTTLLDEEEQIATAAEKATSIVEKQVSWVWKMLLHMQNVYTKVGSSEAGRSSEEKAPGG